MVHRSIHVACHFMAFSFRDFIGLIDDFVRVICALTFGIILALLSAFGGRSTQNWGAGARLGQGWDKAGTRLGQGWGKAGARLAHKCINSPCI